MSWKSGGPTVSNSEVLAQLAGLIGRRLATALCRSEGGRSCYVPVRLSNRARLVNLIGRAATAQLQTRWAGRWIMLPTLADADRDQRNDLIRKMAADGISNRELALRFDLTTRMIRNILRS